MKQNLALLLAFSMLLLVLTGCEHFVPSDGVESRPPLMPPSEEGTVPTGGPEATEEPDPAEETYGFTVFPEGNYLADPKFDTDEFLPDYDMDINFVQHGSTQKEGLCVTEDTIYFYWDGHLLFTDKGTGITLPLCGKPECTHTDRSCNAYIGGEVAGLRVYDGKLYWIEDGQNVMRMGLDGTAHESVTSLDPSLRTQISGDATWVIHRGYLYVAGGNAVVTAGQTGCSFIVYAQPLDGGEGFTILDGTGPGGGTQYCGLKPAGNELYIMTYSFTYKDPEKREGIIKYVNYYKWDSKTRRVERLYTQDENSPVNLNTYEYCFPLPVPGDGLYFCCIEHAEDDSVVCRIYKCSFETGAVELTAELPDSDTWPRFTEKHIIVSDDGCYLFYDYNGHFLSKVGPTNPPPSAMLMGEDNQYVYYRNDGDFDAPRDGYAAIPLDGGEVLVLH